MTGPGGANPGADGGQGDDGDGEDTDAGNGGGPAAQLRVSEIDVSESLLEVTVVLENTDEAEPLPVAPSLFRVVDSDQSADAAFLGICDGGAFLYQGGRVTCALQLPWTAERAASEIVWAEPGGRSVSGAVGGECAVRAESTAEACRDRCSNDGDRFPDCDDFDCSRTSTASGWSSARRSRRAARCPAAVADRYRPSVPTGVAVGRPPERQGC